MKISVYEPNSYHLREVLIFLLQYEEICGWGLSNVLKYLWWVLLVKERVVSDFNASKTVILTSKTGIAMEERRFSKMQNWITWARLVSKSRRIGKIIRRSLTQQAISKRLKAMGMIQKQGNWVPTYVNWVRIEAERCWTTFVCLWTAAWKAKTEGISASHCD